MSNIEPWTGGHAVAPRDARRLSRSRSGMNVSREIREALTDVETDVAIGKMQNVTMATHAGMSAIVNVASSQKSLEQMAPDTSGRLALIADSHALEMADTLQDLRHRLRRI
jgi:hypothetical protein